MAANCGLASPEAKPSREAYPPTEGRCRRQSLEWWRYAGCEQVGRRPRHRAAWRRKNAASQLNLESGEVELPGDAYFAAFVERAV